MKYLDAIIEKGIILLIIFTPLAIGTTQPWSVSVMEISVFFIFGVWLLKSSLHPGPKPVQDKSTAMLAAIIGIVLLQVTPLPYKPLSILSPSASRIYHEFADYKGDSWRTISLYRAATMDELFKFLSYAAIFMVIIKHVNTKEQLGRIVKAIIYTASFLVIFAVAQKMTWNGRLFWFYPLKAELQSDSGHIWGPYINRNHFAGYMEMAVPLAMGLLLYKTTHLGNLSILPLKRRISRFMDNKDFMPIVLLSLSILAMSSAIFLCMSRGGMIGLASSMLFFTVTSRARKSLKKGAGLLALSGLLIFLFVMVISWSRIEARFGEIGEEGKILRPDVWADTLATARDFPIFGTGLGTFRNIYPIYQTKYSYYFFEHAENDYVEILTDTGLAGLITFTSIASLLFYAVIKRWRQRRNTYVKCIAAGGLSSCLAIAVHSFTDFNLRIPANAFLLTVIAALSYAAVYNVRDRKGLPHMPMRPGAGVIWKISSSVLLTAALLIFPFRTLIADYHYGRVSSILDDRSTGHLDKLPVSGDSMMNYRAAISSLEAAVYIDGRRPIYYKALSEIYTIEGKWSKTMESLNVPLPPGAFPSKEAFEKAAQYLKTAVDMEPTNPDYHLALGQLYDIIGDTGDLADKELARAVKAYPINAPLRHSVANHYLLMGRNGDALEQAKILAKIDDSYIMPDSIQKRLSVKSIAPGYISSLSNSYLFRAFEIAWRASAEDPEVIKGIAPDNPDAKEVVRLFLEWKGIE